MKMLSLLFVAVLILAFYAVMASSPSPSSSYSPTITPAPEPYLISGAQNTMKDFVLTLIDIVLTIIFSPIV